MSPTHWLKAEDTIFLIQNPKPNCHSLMPSLVPQEEVSQQKKKPKRGTKVFSLFSL
jgi:hypothetical protein